MCWAEDPARRPTAAEVVELLEALGSCWVEDPARRPTAAEVVELLGQADKSLGEH